MAINPETQYAGKITPASADYPYGEARNITTPGDGTGTPWEAALLNDIFGFQQSLLSDASVVPSGTPDKVGASQYMQALARSSGKVKDNHAALRLVESAQLSDRTGCLITDSNTHGFFALDKTDTTTVDDNGLTIVDADGGRWKRLYNDAIDFKWFDAKGDDSTDDTVAIQAAFDTGENISATKAIYIVTNIDISNSNAVIDFNNATIKSTTTPDPLEIKAIDDVTIKNLNIETTVSGHGTNFMGLMWSIDSDISNLSVLDTTFTCASQETNGVKLIQQAVGGYLKDVTFERCRFENIGRMGIEIQNHNYTAIENRFTNIDVINCVFNNLGTQSTFGMGVSFSGHGKANSVIDSSFEDCKDICIESVNPLATTIKNNKFLNQTATVKYISFTGVYDTYQHTIVDNYTVDDITYSNPANARIFLYNINNSIISGNNLHLAAEPILFDNANDNTFSNNIIKMTGNNCLQFQNGCTGNAIKNNTLDSSDSVFATAVVDFDGATTINNLMDNNILGEGAGGVFVSNSNSATKNYAINSKKLSDLSYVFGFVDVAMADADFDMENSEYGIVIPKLIRFTGTHTAQRFVDVPLQYEHFGIFNSTTQTLRLRTGGNSGDTISVAEKVYAAYNGFNHYKI